MFLFLPVCAASFMFWCEYCYLILYKNYWKS